MHTQRHTRERTDEARGSAILASMYALKAYLCNGAEEHYSWRLGDTRLARRVLGVFAGHPERWTLVDGWKRRLESAGLNENCEVVDAEKWERAYRQLCERGNYDPSLARVEEAMGVVPEPIEGKNAEAKQQPATPIPMRVTGKKLGFGNAQH